jgi:hypothetical protein
VSRTGGDISAAGGPAQTADDKTCEGNWQWVPWRGGVNCRATHPHGCVGHDHCTLGNMQSQDGGHCLGLYVLQGPAAVCHEDVAEQGVNDRVRVREEPRNAQRAMQS